MTTVAFSLQSKCPSLPLHALAPNTFKNALSSFSDAHYAAFIRLWLTECIPQAFERLPFVYEEMRGWLGQELQTPPKAFTVVGSARLGFSLAPGKFGQPLQPSSDLDFVCIDESLFRGCWIDGTRWLSDYRGGTIRPSRGAQATVWAQNEEVIESQWRRGFVNTWYIPTYERYPKISHVLDTMATLTRKLNATVDAPKLKKASLRIYRDSDCLFRQVKLSLVSLAKSFNSKLEDPL